MQRTLDRQRVGLLCYTSVEVSTEKLASMSGACIVCISLVNSRPVNTVVMCFRRQYAGKRLFLFPLSSVHCQRFCLTYLQYVVLITVTLIMCFIVSVTCLLMHLHFYVQRLFSFCKLYYPSLSLLFSLAGKDNSHSPVDCLIYSFC